MIPFRYFLILALVLGIFLPQVGIIGKDFLIFALSGSILCALLATRQELKFEKKEFAKGIVFGYVVLFGITMLLSFFFPADMKTGLVLYALFPPAVSVIVLSKHWGGKPRDVFLFLLISYAASFFLIPLASSILIGSSVDATVLFKYLIYSFAIPIAIAYFVRIERKELASDLSNILLACVFYIVIATNRAQLIGNFSTLLPYALAFGIVSFLTTFAVLKYTKDPDAVLYSFMKNGGAASGVSSLILPPFATLIISAKVCMDVILLIVFEKMVHHECKTKQHALLSQTPD